MADAKFACPHCNGHIAYSPDMGGRGVACPHCKQPIILPKTIPLFARITITVLGLVFVGLGASLVLELIKGHHPPPPPPVQTQVRVPATPPPPPKPQFGPFAAQSPDDKDIERLCQQYYDGQSARDAGTIHGLFSGNSQKAIEPDDVFIDAASFSSVKLDAIEYRDGNGGKVALAKVKRTSSSSGGPQETTRDLEFVKEADGWKLFPVFDLARKVVTEFTKNNFSEAVTNNLQLLRSGDAFNAWSQNDTNAFEAAFKLYQRRNGIFPWDLTFSVDSNKVDNLILILNYTIGNHGSNTWPATLLEFSLRKDGSTVSTENDLMPSATNGQTFQRSVSFLLKEKLGQTTEYHLDVGYPAGFQSHFPLIRSLPLEFTVRPVSELARLEVMGTQIESTVSADGQNIFLPRIDFEVKSISAEPIQSLDVKCEWFTLNGDQIDQTTQFVVGYGDTPLAVGQSKSGIVRCSKASSNSKVPVKVDVYLESGEKRTLVSKGLLIQ